MLLSILTISRNEKKINDLLVSLSHAGLPTSAEVLISWNGSSEGKENIEIPGNMVVRVFDRTPYHFAENNNFLVTKSEAKYVLFLNDDILLDRNSIKVALDAISDPYVGIVGANLRYPNDFLQHAGVLFDDDGKPFHRHKHKLKWDAPEVRNDCFSPAVTGAFVLMRRTEFLELRFDEKFQVAGEDIALCLAYREKFPREILYVAKATGVHEENATRKQTGTRQTPEADMARIMSYSKRQVDGWPLSKVRHPKIRIITEPPGWIMHRKASEIQKHLGNVRVNEDWDDADVHYYINYGKYKSRPKSGLAVANFTHYDPDVLATEFEAVAHEVDHCIAVSEATADKLRTFGVPNDKISVILVGADASQFRPKLTLGIVGRVYKGGRKGEDLVHALVADTEIMQTTTIFALRDDWGVPVWGGDDQANFYRSIDYLLIPSRLEGGPVPFMEALACGTLSIAPPIGVIPQFPHIPYKTGNIDDLKKVITRLATEKIAQKSHLANHLFRIDWSGWAVEHSKVFRRLLASRHQLQT